MDKNIRAKMSLWSNFRFKGRKLNKEIRLYLILFNLHKKLLKIFKIPSILHTIFFRFSLNPKDSKRYLPILFLMAYYI